VVAAAPGDLPEALLPVPLYVARLRQRGFNQSVELSRPLAASLQLPLLLHEVQRVCDTGSQTGLSRTARRRNIRGAFRLAAPLRFDHVAIVDDVVTTTSTVNELAGVLKRAGARRVDVWSVARAGKG
jgi:ComF family protein